MKRSDFLKTLGSASLPLALPLAIKHAGKQNLNRPKKMMPGDVMGLVAPAGIIYDEAEFERMQRELAELGLRSVFGDHVRNRHGYLAGTDQQRAADLNAMFEDPDIDGIMAVRGGWGCARILPHLNFETIADNPKVYCGFSDNTTLHHALMAYSNLQTFHGPNGNSDWTDLTKQSFESVVMKGELSTYQSDSMVSILMPGKATGRLIGGNLSILTTTLGTPYQANFDDAILFVEDIGEDTYKIDRMMSHLEQAGILDVISGFVFGKCTDCSAGSPPTFSLLEVLKHYLDRYQIPSIYNTDIGHEQDNFTIPMGGLAELDADNGVITLLEPAVQ
ncbi:S66 peptidase family protein [Rhodohalobacter sp. 8-1]|uniref:S66 peptidase family protein n=1 Tax=Rhodohalobacter sp. 8-1 TaxID=3131972 RepID=UPI0030EB2952